MLFNNQYIVLIDFNMEWKMQSLFTQAEKEAIVREVKEVGNRNLVGRKHGISESAIRNWERNEQKKKDPKTEEDVKN